MIQDKGENKNLMNRVKYKRPFDFVISLIAIIILSPILLLICIFIYINMGYPIIFSQVRPGFKSKAFKIYKFRTMTNDKDVNGILLPENERITKFGNILRKTSLDELPELYNVLRGDMSLVGPRPLLMEYLPLYSIDQIRRHEVKPGITGWAQVNGRNNLIWNERFKYDLWYVKKCSMQFDLKILFLTLKNIFSFEDIKIEGYFTGNSENKSI